jgi:hypothetical protein
MSSMTCRSTRDDYIQSVNDLCEMTRHLLQMQEEYVTAVRDGAPVRANEALRRWRLYTGGITRLLNEERNCFEDFEAASRAHSA